MKKPASKIPRMSTEDLSKFVEDALSGAVFTSAQIPPSKDSVLPMVFLPLALGGLANLSKKDLNEIGIFWEYYNKSLPRSINGLPIFMSAHVMHKDDWKIAYDTIQKEQKKQKKGIRKNILRQKEKN